MASVAPGRPCPRAAAVARIRFCECMSVKNALLAVRRLISAQEYVTPDVDFETGTPPRVDNNHRVSVSLCCRAKNCAVRCL